ncbi:MAG: hypothetical protein JW938_04820 [Candidatus Omnitrophica bacterium]|nr:hypothetical protein [Candidatus Omnitrophota bacterium]
MIIINVKYYRRHLKKVRSFLRDRSTSTETLVFRDQAQADYFQSELNLTNPLTVCEELLSLADYNEINDAAYSFLDRSLPMLQDEENHKGCFEYRGINIPKQIVLFNYIPKIVQYLKTTRIVTNILKTLAPSHIVTITDEFVFFQILSQAANVHNVPLQYAKCLDKTVVIKERDPFKLVSFVLKPLQFLCFISHLHNAVMKHKRKPIGNKKRIAFIYANAALSRHIDRSKFSLIVLPSLFSLKEWLHYIRNGDLYWHITSSSNATLTHINERSKISKTYRTLWAQASHNKTFLDAVVFDNIPLWDVFKPLFRDLLLVKLSFYLKVTDNILAMIQTFKPDLFASNVGMFPDERIALALFKKHGIPTLLMKAGVGITNSLACSEKQIHSDYISVWGQYIKDQIDSFNTYKKCFILGAFNLYHALERPTLPKATLCRDLNMSPNDRYIVYATTLSSDYQWAAHRRHDLPYVSLRILCESLTAIQDYHLVIKLHPRENIEGYTSFIRSLPAVLQARIHVLAKIDLYSLIKNSDAVVTPGSTVGIEAMIFKKYVIILQPFKVPDGRPFHKYNASFQAKNAEDMISILQAMRSNNINYDEMILNQRRLLEELLFYSDNRYDERLKMMLSEICP